MVVVILILRVVVVLFSKVNYVRFQTLQWLGNNKNQCGSFDTPTVSNFNLLGIFIIS